MTKERIAEIERRHSMPVRDKWHPMFQAREDIHELLAAYAQVVSERDGAERAFQAELGLRQQVEAKLKAETKRADEAESERDAIELEFACYKARMKCHEEKACDRYMLQAELDRVTAECDRLKAMCEAYVGAIFTWYNSCFAMLCHSCIYYKVRDENGDPTDVCRNCDNISSNWIFDFERFAKG